MRKVWLFLLALCVVGFVPVYAQEEDEPVSMVDGKPDTDGDGIPDEWETKFGLNPNNMFDAKMDVDGDKIKNIDEYKLKTDPKDKDFDKNKDGVPDDWMKFFGLTDAKADDDGDEVSNKEEFDSGTNPKDKESSPKKVATVSQKHPDPSMDGVKENIDSSIPDNHLIKPNVLKFMDPIGDDKGPGYYTYPTNPVYVNGGFDIVSFEIDASGADNVIFKITVNADLKQEWGMAADFDIQMFEIYIDQDKVPGSGNVKCVPGLNVYFDPANAWEKAVIVSPQQNSRVEIEIAVKASEMAQDIVVPVKVTGIGRTLTAVVSKKALGITEETDISKWGWQLIAQSNEGYPDAEDLLTRNVNEFKGLHRFGGGNDYWGDPELMDMLVWPAKGTMQEAKDQFSVLNVWESYPDPKMDIRAVVPLIFSDQTEQWNPAGGYTEFAKDLATKIKPPAMKDKYVSDNFQLYGKLFTRWNWNLDISKENKIRNSLEIGIDGKLFSSVIDFYIRLELNQWENTEWKQWANSTPGQVDLALQARRVMLISLFPTVDLITIGNNEVNYSAWTLGQPWYPDRDKTMGIFIDGSVEKSFIYSLTVHYTMEWLGFDWGHGGNNIYDLVYAYKLAGTPFDFLKLSHSTVIYTDFEVNPQSTAPKSVMLKGYNLGSELDGILTLPGGFFFNFLGAYAETRIDDEFNKVEIGYELDIDNNGRLGVLADNTINPTNSLYLNDWAAVIAIKNDNIFGSGIGLVIEGFRIGQNFNVLTSSRGDSAGSLGGFGGGSTAGTADVLTMNGNQSVHRSPQAADFVESVPLPALPTEYIISDPVTTTKSVGWVNDSWEGVSALGWYGATVLLNGNFNMLRIRLEGSLIKFGNNSVYLSATKGDPDNFYQQATNTIKYSDLTRMRAYLAVSYDLAVLEGMTLLLSGKYENNGTAFADFASYKVSKNYMQFGLDATIKWTKLFQTTLGTKVEIASFKDGFYGISGTEVYVSENTTYNRLIFPVSFLYSLPVGFYKLSGGIWTILSYQGQDALKNWSDKNPGAKYGAYFVMEWEYGF
ncbi:MAG: hypothetical protein A2Y33_00765 [Spirochaetes bacterium GWF1_51_8]|nr:MAG: hypothetical protein A2Y33_00765 [Spirochaetes bacterium GWF1_51_8]